MTLWCRDTDKDEFCVFEGRRRKSQVESLV